LAARDNPLADMQSVPMSALAEENWLERTGCDLTRKFWDLIFTDGRSPKISHRSKHESHLQNMVEAGLGIMVASAHTPRLPSLVACPIRDDPMRWTVNLLVIAGRRYTPALDAFIKIARLRDWKAGNAETPIPRAGSPKSVTRTKVDLRET
jgi:DNA-binding transcriptional LysR family regulator